MVGKYTKLIEEYCEENSIFIPAGFYRGAACHIAVIRRDLEQPKLVAKTFFNKSDVKYYLEKMEVENSDLEKIASVLDFKNEKEYVVGNDRKPKEL